MIHLVGHEEFFKKIGVKEYEAAKRIIVEYEQQQGQRPVYECLCRKVGLKPWQTDNCPHAEEQHNDNWVCTRKVKAEK